MHQDDDKRDEGGREVHRTGLPRRDADWGRHSVHGGFNDIFDEDGERLVRREDVEQPIPPMFGPVLGSWWFTTILIGLFVAAMAIAIGYGSIGNMIESWDGEPEKQHSGGHHGKESLVKLPPEVAKHVKGNYTWGTDGSPKEYAGAISYLHAGQRDDSNMEVTDISWDLYDARAFSHGCGRDWYVRDPDGYTGKHGWRETGCNLSFHQTGIIGTQSGKVYWSRPSTHGH